jgi:hypothetical protein
LVFDLSQVEEFYEILLLLEVLKNLTHVEELLCSSSPGSGLMTLTKKN